MTATRNLSRFVRHLDGGVARMELEVSCLLRAGCTQAIEGSLAAIPDITLARVSVADRRVEVEWRDGKVDPARFINRLSELGYEAHPCDAAGSPVGPAAGGNQKLPALLCRAGVAAAAVAALIVGRLSVLAVPETAPGITPDLRAFIAWLSALIAVSAAAWAGRPVFAAAARAAAAGRMSPEAPVSAGIALAFGLSAFEMPGGAVPVSCESGLLLLAAALAVCALELAVQQHAPAATGVLIPRAGDPVTKFVSGTELAEVPAGSVRPGDLVLVRPGERIAVDGIVTEGRSEIDQSRVSGETLPAAAARDSMVHAGTHNLSGTLRVRVGAAEHCALPDGVRCMSARSAGHARLSERVALLCAPLILAVALATLIGRMAFGAAWHDAVAAAIAVLAVMHPAAFGLAVSAAETWAARALSRAGVLLKSRDAVERLARVDTLLFDKTGTLTLTEPEVINAADIPPERLALAGRLALASRHPLAAAVARVADAVAPIPAVEEPGQGVRCVFHGVPLRLGRPSFCDAERGAAALLDTDPEASVIAFAYGTERHVLAVRQRLRGDAIEAIAQLKHDGVTVEILSGDRAPAVAHAARTLGIERWRAGMTPADKTGHISVLQARGRTVLMVGDGLNDAPALAAADAALAVARAMPPALAAADGVFAGDRLAAVPAAITIARRARQVRRQNLVLAATCAAVVLPLAIVGVASPLAAVLATSGVAVLVTLNAMRSRFSRVRTGSAISKRPHQ